MFACCSLFLKLHQHVVVTTQLRKKKFSLSFFMSSLALFFPFSFCPFAISSLPLSFQDFVLSSSHFSSWVFLSYYLSFSLCCLPVSANFLFLPVQTTVEEGFLCQLFLPLWFFAALRGYILKDENRMRLLEGETWNLVVCCLFSDFGITSTTLDL